MPSARHPSVSDFCWTTDGEVYGSPYGKIWAGFQWVITSAAAIMSLIQTALLNGHNPVAYLKDALTRLPSNRQKDIETLLP